MKHLFSLIHSASSDIQATVEDVIAQGEKAVFRLNSRRTDTGEFMGIPPTEKLLACFRQRLAESDQPRPTANPTAKNA